MKAPSIVAILTALVLLAACGGGTGEDTAGAGSTDVVVRTVSEPGEIVIWHGYRAEEKAAFEKAVAQFNEAMAPQGVSATTLAVPFDAFADKITAAVPRGKGPDVFIFAQDRLGGWIEAGNTIEPIDFYLDDDTTSRFIPSTMDAMTYQGTVYGLPLNFKVITMIYNKALVETPPATSDQLVATAGALTESAAGKYGLAYAYSDFYYHAALMNAFGGGVFDDARRPTLDRPENVKSLEQMMKWYKGDGILPAEPSTALITSLFNQGNSGIVFNGPWFLGEIAEEVDYALAPLPTITEAGGEPMRPWMTVEGVYIAAPSEHKEAAMAFVDYVTSLPAAKILAVEGRQTPANQFVYDDPAVGEDPILKVFREQVEVAIPMPNLAEMTMVWSPATTAMNTIVRGSASPKNAMETAQREVLERLETLRSGSRSWIRTDRTGSGRRRDCCSPCSWAAV
jgi:arabinogalactan oligomer/maltooligosaccharide transport system substrate-binding protein